MQRAAIIGCGLIGRAWAVSFARGGYEVTLWDEVPATVERALRAAAVAVEDLAAHDLLAGARPAEVLARLRPEEELAAALAGATHVQESAFERLETKRLLFARLDALASPEAVLASSTSGILPSAFTAGLPGRARCLVAHPINPPYLVPAVEVVPAPWTDPRVVGETADRLASIGQAPIVMTRELPGFLMNRIQAAALCEAYRLVAAGYASVEDVDRGLKEGIGLRWSFIGPFEVGDLNAPGGIADYVARYEPLWREIAAAQAQFPEMGGETLEEIVRQRRARLPQERIAARQEWRDRRLMALAAHKREADRRFGR